SFPVIFSPPIPPISDLLVFHQPFLFVNQSNSHHVSCSHPNCANVFHPEPCFFPVTFVRRYCLHAWPRPQYHSPVIYVPPSSPSVFSWALASPQFSYEHLYLPRAQWASAPDAGDDIFE
ncbi:hypothetical protein DFH09DRAFT_1277420, partial [Mycena vulgaris]